MQVAEKRITEASIKKDLEEWQFQLVKDFILSLQMKVALKLNKIDFYLIDLSVNMHAHINHIMV